MLANSTSACVSGPWLGCAEVLVHQKVLAADLALEGETFGGVQP